MYVCCPLTKCMYVVPSQSVCMLSPHKVYVCCPLTKCMYVVPSQSVCMLSPHKVYVCCPLTTTDGPVKQTWVGRIFETPRGWGSTFQSEVTTVKLMCFLCHRKYNNDAYKFVAGCTRQFFIYLLQFVCTPC